MSKAKTTKTVKAVKTIKAAKAAVVMGSDSDLAVLKDCIKTLKQFEVEVEAMVCSVHRTLDKAAEFAKNAEDNGFDIIIAGAGKAAHLPSILAAYTPLPVIGVPIKSSALDGLDSLLSVAQMQSGIPIATVAIDGAENAALLAVQVLSIGYSELRDKMKEYKKKLAKKVEEKNEALQEKIKDI
ncbi:MAG: 5-(carboxyamino)imidazole ribonucleotide mutase [Bacillota bacterium]